MKWQGVCVHCSATRDGAVSDWEAIRRYHIETNGWDEIGYHYGIEMVGDILRLRIGRPLSMPGAHAVGLNSTHIGICVIGDFDRELPSVTRLDYLALVIADICRFYKLPVNTTTIRYHRDVADKTCPGDLFPPKDLFLRMVEKYSK